MKIVKKILLVLSFLAIGSGSLLAHPFYVSICQVDFNKVNRRLEISVKIFADDLLLALNNMGKSKIFLGEKHENQSTNEYIFEYLKSNLAFKINNEKKDYNFIGKEIEGDVVWTYLEINDIHFLREIEVKCKILTEVFETQSTIIQINSGNKIRNLLLNKEKYVDALTLN